MPAPVVNCHKKSKRYYFAFSKQHQRWLVFHIVLTNVCTSLLLVDYFVYKWNNKNYTNQFFYLLVDHTEVGHLYNPEIQ